MKHFTLIVVLFVMTVAIALAEDNAAPVVSADAPLAANSSATAKIEGTASWYGGKFQGRQTANGEIFDTRAYTAAHRTLPFGTLVRLINLENQKSTTVRINDRGPFVGDRMIDVSQAAAIDLDMMKTGVARVSLEVIERPAAQSGSVYRIQVASFKDPGNARKIRTALTEKGLTVYCETVVDGYTRVHIDNVAHADLATVEAILRGLGFDKHLVRKIN